VRSDTIGAPLPAWVLVLLNNPTFAALAGAVVGVVVGAAFSYLVAIRLARRTRRDTHRAAVRAVLYELTENVPKVEEPSFRGVLTTAAYDSLVVPLYTDLPDDVAHFVAIAYGLLHVIGPGIALVQPETVHLLQTAVTNAESKLRTYAEKNFRMKFDLTTNA